MNVDNLVAVLAVAAVVPLVLAAMPRVPVPGPVLEIVAGIVLGPAVLGVVHPDAAVRLVATIGLAFLLFLAGLEIDIRHFRGSRARQASLGLAVSIVLGLIVGVVLHATGVVESPLLIGVILIATSLGLIIPILKDAGASERPVGQFAIAGASLGEVSAVVLLSLFFSEHSSGLGSKLLLLLLLAVLVTLVVVLTTRAGHSMRVSRVISRLADTSAQIRIRLSVLLVVGLGAVAMHLGFEAILGAFIAGGILRLVDADAEETHPQFHTKLEGLGYGFLIPVFFVTSGLTFNLSVLFSSVGTVLRIPLFLAALLVVRGLPVIVYRGSISRRRELVAAALLQATSLPFIVAATTIGLRLGAIRAANAAALVAAGLLSVIVFPAIALQLLKDAPAEPSPSTPVIDVRDSSGRPGPHRGIAHAAKSGLIVMLIVAASVTGHGLVVSAHASAAGPSRTVVVHTTGSVSGDSFGAVVDAFAFHSPTASGVNATVDATVGTAIECQTDTTNVVVATQGLDRVAVSGTVFGTCFDFDSSQSTSWRAAVHLEWQGEGRVQVDSFNDGACTTVFEQRSSVERGSLDWTIPSTGQSGTATPIFDSILERDTTRCAAGS